jgi:hypothetical protein
MAKIINPILIFLLLISCVNGSRKRDEHDVRKPVHRIDSLKWMCGTWEMKVEDGWFFESWEQKNDTTFLGVGFLISGKDTLSFENITISQQGSELFYIPVVSGQNNGDRVIFRLVSTKDGKWTFENPAHDFPQRIIYSNQETGSLVAVITGIDKGKERTEVFSMRSVSLH